MNVIKSVLKWAGLLPAARRIRRWAVITVSPAVRRQERERRREFVKFKRVHADALGCRLRPDGWGEKKALFVSSGLVDAVRTEIGLIKGLELAGFTPVVLTPPDRWLVKHYELARVQQILAWEDFLSPPDAVQGEAVVARLQSLEDLLTFEHEGVRVGRFAASTALRWLRVGALNLESRDARARLVPFIASAMTYASAAQALVRRVKPELALFPDRGYTPAGELFDICLGDGVDVVTWNAAHKNNALMVKRYTRENRDDHPASLSPASWERVQHMGWAEAHRQRLRQELHGCYASGEWYSEVGTQFNTRIMDPGEIRRRLGLDPRRKTAVIFPHILWDGTFFYGRDLFGSYEAWFIETVRAACANSRVNWVIKVHPGNMVKGVRDGVHGEPSEVRVIRQCIGPLPEHVRFIPAESDISTFSLYGLTDYCVTVRGTVGIEAASLGIPVLTAGTGRYDERGFTIDSHSRDEYLERIARIHEIPPLSPHQRELAERFAYAVFVLRPLSLTTVTLEYQKDAKATPCARVNATTPEDWLNAPDLRAFADWVADVKQLDFLAPDGDRGFRG